MPDGPLPHIDGPAAFAEAFPVSGETLSRLETYAATLRLWQARINLVSPTTLDDTWHRHFADSAQILGLAPPAPGHWIDLGSGAGFPGLVVAILLADRMPCATRMTLIESDQRKCAFLAEVVRQTRLAAAIPVDILCARIEKAATQSRVRKADVVSARALAPLDKLLGLASPLLQPSGRGLFLKGRGIEAELAAARVSWTFSYELVASRTEAEARIVVLHGPAIGAEG